MISGAGKMGWKESDFWLSTPSFFFTALSGHMDQEVDRTNMGFAQARMVAYYAGAQNLREGTEMRDLYPLPWDDKIKKAKFEPIDPEELAKFEAAAARAYAKLNENVGSST